MRGHQNPVFELMKDACEPARWIASPALRLPRSCNCYLDICGVVVVVVVIETVIDSRVRVGVMSILHHFTYSDMLKRFDASNR